MQVSIPEAALSDKSRWQDQSLVVIIPDEQMRVKVDYQLC
jgi:hypothetical protein